MYYILQCFSPLLQDAAGLDACPEVPGVESWMSGSWIPGPVPEPIEVGLDPESPGVLLEMYQVEMLLMTERLVAALQQAGVDNLQVFRAVLRDPQSGREHTHYRAVNVVGAVACADAEKSVRAAGPGLDFESLALDESRAGGRLLFRLAECLSAIVVHERVKQAVESAGITGLTFQRPEEFVG